MTNVILIRGQFSLAIAILLLIVPIPVSAQLSGVVRPTRLIATTTDPLPGNPDVHFASFAGATLARGSHVAFYGYLDLPGAALFYRGASTLEQIGSSSSTVWPDPPTGVPFSTWDDTGIPIADEASVAFDGVRHDWFCDSPGSCSTSSTPGIFTSLDGLPPNTTVEGSQGLPVYEPTLLGFDSGSLLYTGIDEVLLDGLPVLRSGDLLDGYTMLDIGGAWGFKNGIGYAFSGVGISADDVYTSGIWARIHGTWATVATTDTEIPGFPGLNFTSFGQPAVGSASTFPVFFGAANFNQKGIYRLGGGLVKVADTTDSVMAQGFLEDLYDIGGTVAVEGLEIAFQANSNSHLIVADAVTDELRTVLSIGDILRFGRKEYEVWAFSMHTDSFSQGNIVVNGTLGIPNDPLGPQFDAVFIVDTDGNGIGGPGSSQADPFLPTSVETDPESGLPVSHFEGAPSVAWIDPPLASGFTYTMTGPSLFTAILDLPTGFNAPFEVLVGAVSLGTFSPDTVIDFGAGVSEFTIQGIDPAVDAEAHAPFAVQLEFDTLYASFTATPIPAPEPSVALAMPLAMLGVTLLCRRRERHARRTDPRHPTS